MPPKSVKTLKDLLYWQYAKIIAQSSGMGKFQYAFVQERYQKLKNGEIKWNSIREYVREREQKDTCIYCSKKCLDLTQDHLLPRVWDGPQDEKNIVWVCKQCNSQKGDRRPYEWWSAIHGLKEAKYNLPRIAEGKYIKLLHELLESKGLLNIDEVSKFCARCSIANLCKELGTSGKLEVLCLDGIVSI